MAVYTYTTLDTKDRSARGTLAADTPAAGRQRLRERGLRIVRFTETQPGCAATPLSARLRSHRRRTERVAEAARSLSLLLRAGVPLTEALFVMTDKLRGRFALVLTQVREQVLHGASLADALAMHRSWFDTLFVGAVRVGELSGRLDDALADLAEHLHTAQQLRGRLTAALTYPIILILLGAGVVVFMMSYVVPQLMHVLVLADRPLPASTALLKRLSDGLVHHGWLYGVALVGVAIGMAYAIRTERGRQRWHRIQLGLPWVGPLIRRSLVARFAQQMTLLLRSGVAFVPALRQVATLTPNRVLTVELTAMAEAVEAGADIAVAMHSSRIFPPLVVRLVAVGQDSGELTAMLDELRRRYRQEVEIALAKLTAALEPLLILAIAAAVGFVVLACMAPMLEVTRGIA